MHLFRVSDSTAKLAGLAMQISKKEVAHFHADSHYSIVQMYCRSAVLASFSFFSPPKKIPNYVAAFLIKMRGMWTKAEEETFAVVPILTVRLQSPK